MRFGDKRLPRVLWAKLRRSGPKGCWIGDWKPKSKGYVWIWWKKRQVALHRLMYTIANGPIPKGLQLDHLCRVKKCCNPVHLEAVTSAENTRRAWEKCEPRQAKLPSSPGIGALIRGNRERKRWSMRKLGRVVGVSGQAVSLWESGETNPSVQSAVALGKLFGRSKNNFIPS